MSEQAKRRLGTTRLSRKNQVTIPVAVLQAAHLEPGDVLQVQVDGDGRLLLIREQDPLASLIGAFPGLSEAADLEGLHAEWERWDKRWDGVDARVRIVGLS